MGTFDFLYTRGVNTFRVMDVSLNGPLGVAVGEGGRVMYGTVDPATGEAEPSRRTSPDLEAVFENRNASGDRAFSTVPSWGAFGNGVEVSAAYTFTDAVDRASSPRGLRPDPISAPRR